VVVATRHAKEVEPVLVVVEQANTVLKPVMPSRLATLFKSLSRRVALAQQ